MILTKTTSDEFTVKWDPPERYENNKDIIGYHIIFWRATDSTMNYTEYVTVNTSFTATELDAGTVYLFRVAAFTENGTGVFKQLENISTIPIGKCTQFYSQRVQIPYIHTYI